MVARCTSACSGQAGRALTTEYSPRSALWSPPAGTVASSELAPGVQDDVHTMLTVAAAASENRPVFGQGGLQSLAEVDDTAWLGLWAGFGAFRGLS